MTKTGKSVRLCGRSQARRVCLPFTVAREPLRAPAVEAFARQIVATFAQAELQQRGATALVAVDKVQRVNGPVDTAGPKRGRFHEGRVHRQAAALPRAGDRSGRG